MQERLALFLEDVAIANSLSSDDDHREAIRALVVLYEEGEEIHPTASAHVAMRIGLLSLREDRRDDGIAWLTRAIEDGERAGGDEGVTGALSRAHLAYELEKLERWEEAARVLAVPKGHTPGASLGASWNAPYSSAQNFARAGLYEEAREQFLIAERASIREGDHPSTTFQIRRAVIHEGSGLGIGYQNDPRERQEELLARSIELYDHPYYRDVPDRLNMAGLPVATIAAITLKDYDMVESITTDIMHEAARLEALLGREAIDKAMVPQAYICSATYLAMAHADRGDHMLALEALESAARTYPDHDLVQGDMVLGQIAATRELLGLPPFDPEATGASDAGRFHIAGGYEREPDHALREENAHHASIVSAEAQSWEAAQQQTGQRERRSDADTHTSRARWAAVAIGVIAVGGVIARLRR
ncbi:MAG: hypothetical protein AAGH64_02060 [Planctomycetota bacterium]